MDLIERLLKGSDDFITSMALRKEAAATIARLTGEVEELRGEVERLQKVSGDLIAERLTIKKDMVEECATFFESVSDIHPQWTADEVADKLRDMGTTPSSSGGNLTTGDQRGEIAAK